MNNISIAIIICTYKREQYVLKNIDILKKYCKDVIKEVFIIDNGQTLPVSLSDGFIHIIPNKNLGGSGGYARGMYEVHKHSDYSHIMLMDDDIEFTPDVLHIAYNKLCDFSKDEKDDWIGFGMVAFDEPNKLYECGAYWNGIRAKRNNRGFNLNSDKLLNSNLKYNYSAWWSIIMPTSVIDRYGYPYPFFIKFDDTEFGLRRKNEKIHFYKELYIKHEPFRNKYSCLIDYYGLRNSLITNILHYKSNVSSIVVRYTTNIFKRYLSFNINGVRMANKGLEDFLKGPSFWPNESEIAQYSKTKFSKIKVMLLFPLLYIIEFCRIIKKIKITKNEYLNSYKFYTSADYWEKCFK